jgi:hypothetical protein
MLPFSVCKIAAYALAGLLNPVFGSRSHRTIVPSLPSEARVLLSGLKATLDTDPVCLVSGCPIGSRVSTSHKMIVPSSPLEARVSDWVIAVGYVGSIQMVTPSLNGIKGCEPFWKSGMNLKSQHLSV